MGLYPAVTTMTQPPLTTARGATPCGAYISYFFQVYIATERADQSQGNCEADKGRLLCAGSARYGGVALQPAPCRRLLCLAASALR